VNFYPVHLHVRSLYPNRCNSRYNYINRACRTLNNTELKSMLDHHKSDAEVWIIIVRQTIQAMVFSIFILNCAPPFFSSNWSEICKNWHRALRLSLEVTLSLGSISCGVLGCVLRPAQSQSCFPGAGSRFSQHMIQSAGWGHTARVPCPGLRCGAKSLTACSCCVRCPSLRVTTVICIQGRQMKGDMLVAVFIYLKLQGAGEYYSVGTSAGWLDMPV
jgi:hypothetical protein